MNKPDNTDTEACGREEKRLVLMVRPDGTYHSVGGDPENQDPNNEAYYPAMDWLNNRIDNTERATAATIALWKILDDISTSSDFIKPSTLEGYKAFYKQTIRRVEERGKVAHSPDGYCLVWPNGDVLEKGKNGDEYGPEELQQDFERRMLVIGEACEKPTR